MPSAAEVKDRGVLGEPHFAPKAKRIIYLFMSGAPSQLDLLDYKPVLNQRNGEQLPDSVRGTQRLTGMSGNQSSIPLVGSPFKFTQHGQAGAWFSDQLPHTAAIADDLCVVNSMYTEAINHGPGVTLFQTGTQIAGRPSMGAWLSYGLGQDNANLPSFVVLITKDKSGQPLGSHLWGSGFLPSRHQGVQFRAAKDPVLYLGNPAGVSNESRRMLLDRLKELHEHQLAKTPDRKFRIVSITMRWPMRCRPAFPKPPIFLASRSLCWMSTVRTSQHRDIRRELSAGSPTGRTRRPIYSAVSPGLGSPWRSARSTATHLQGNGPAGGGIGEGSETLRIAGRYAGGLGR